MARPRAHCLPAVLAAVFAGSCLGAAPAKAGPPGGPAAETPRRAAPVRPTAVLWPVTRLFNADYIDVREIARRYNLKADWAVRDKVMHLGDARGARLKFEKQNRDFHLDGVRIFMGEAAVLFKGSLYLGKADVIKLIAPLLRPEEQAGLPPAPPRLIVLDPGHGGGDPGNQNRPLRLDEKDMALDVARRLKKLLEARGCQVLLTRTDDSFVDLEKRAETANRAKADLLLSIHFNAVDPALAAHVTGSETYSMTPQFQHSTADTKKDGLTGLRFPGNGQDCANILLGYHVHRRLLTGLKTSDRGLKRARFVVLRLAGCPAVLVEAAYLSNSTEAKKVALPEYRQVIAQAIADGLDDYAAALQRLHPTPAPEIRAAPSGPPTVTPLPRSAAPAPSPR